MEKEIKYTIGRKEIQFYLYMILRDLKTYSKIIIEASNSNDTVGQEVFGEFYNSFLSDLHKGKVKACKGCIELIKEMNKHFLLYKIGDKEETVPIIYNRLEKAEIIADLVCNIGVDLTNKEVIEGKEGQRIRITLEKQPRFERFS